MNKIFLNREEDKLLYILVLNKREGGGDEVMMEG